MKKLMLLTSAAVLTFGTIGSAQAQRAYYRDGWRGGYYHHHRGWGNGGALAAGLIGGALLGGLVTAAATPAYGYPAYGYPGYSYPAYGYRTYYPSYSYGYGYPAYGYGYGDPYGSYAAPVTTRVVYAPVPVYRTRVVYQQPRYRTRVVRQYRERPRVVRAVRRDVVTTGSIRAHRYPRVQYY